MSAPVALSTLAPASARGDVDELGYLGVRISRLDAAEAAALIAARRAGLPFVYVVTPNAAHFNRLARLGDGRFAEAYDHAWLRLLDGQAPRALGRLLFGLVLPQAAGSDVTLELLARHIRPQDAITVIGGSELIRTRLRERFGLVNVALHVPPMGFIADPAAVDACIDFIRAHPSRYVFLVIGSPQSEYLARMIRQRGGAVGCGLCFGSGLAFATDVVRRAPPAVRRWGLEWLYRLLRDPVGHARRVFVDSLPILLIALRARRDPAAFGMRKGDGSTWR